MPTKRNRRDSESSTCSLNGVASLEEQNVGAEVLNSIPNGDSTCSIESNGDSLEEAWMRPCCNPLGCLTNGLVNLTEAEEIEKIVCSNENCTVGPYMHKDCFTRWEDGLLTYLRSHGRARSWSEKQRRQNLWTKRGYDLAYRACACSCGRGHLRKDLNWDPKDIQLPTDAKKATAEDNTKKKNRKKHKDLPALGNKYTFALNRSKSKAIPANGKDNRVRTNSTSSVLSNDQGYSSSSPSNSEIHGPPGSGFFSPPTNGRSYLQGSVPRITPGYRNPGSHGFNNPLLPLTSLPQIPDNDVLENFCGNLAPFPSFCESQSFCTEKMQNPPSSAAYDVEKNDVLSPLHDAKSFFNHHAQNHHQQQQQQLIEIQKMMHTMELSQRQRCNSWNGPPPSPLAQNIQPPQEKPTMFDIMARQLSMPLLSPGSKSVKPPLELPNQRTPLELSGRQDPLSSSLPLFGHWNQPPASEINDHQCLHSQGRKGSEMDPFCQCYPRNKIADPPPILPFQDFMDNTTTMLCSDIDLKKPKVMVIPGEATSNGNKRTCTEICITPMCSTVFHKRYDFVGFQSILKPNQMNPYHIKMEGEGYGSDDFRNSVLAKLSRAKVSQMNCLTCGKTLPIYDHFPLVDGSLFLSPLRHEGRNMAELKIDIENKSEYLHAICVGCLDGVNNLICVMCDGKWRGPFHQLGSLYMYDIFAATPCCQSRLCCKRCGVAIVDRRLGLKYFSQYSSKATCPSCGAVDYHFVHPASTFRVLGPDKFSCF